MREEKKASCHITRTKMRNKWTGEYRQTVSERVCEQTETSLSLMRNHSIVLYCAIADEVDLIAILEHHQGERKLLTPRAEGDDISLYTHQLDSLVTSEGYKILEPTAAVKKAVDPVEVELILVSGLAFDPHGGHMGRGKGYYDRFFARYPHALCVAATSSMQIVNQTLLEPWNVTTYYIISDGKTYEVRN